MRKKIAVVLCCVFFGVTIGGCMGDDLGEYTKTDTKYNYLLNTGAVTVYTFRDPDTGVWYLSTYRGGVFPRLNPDGSLYATDSKGKAITVDR